MSPIVTILQQLRNVDISTYFLLSLKTCFHTMKIHRKLVMCNAVCYLSWTLNLSHSSHESIMV